MWPSLRVEGAVCCLVRAPRALGWLRIKHKKYHLQLPSPTRAYARHEPGARQVGV